MHITRSRSLALTALLILHPASFLLAQGSLTPPGAPTATMKTLDQIEPRTPISSIPFTISGPGTYYLTANLTGGLSGGGISQNAISISAAAANVTIDLNGFTLTGVAGSLNGISANAGAKNITVRNGKLTNWGTSGIGLANAKGVLLQGIHVSGNVGAGILGGQQSVIENCIAESNGTIGIAVQDGTVRDCTAMNNGTVGIQLGNGSTASGCAVIGSGTDGMTGSRSIVQACEVRTSTGNGFVFTSSTIQACGAHNNGGFGIENAGGSIIDSVAGSNGGDGLRLGATGGRIVGCWAQSNAGDGIEVGGDCVVLNNQCDENALLAVQDGAGIHVTGKGNRIEANHVTANDRGIDVDEIGNFILRNTASANTANYDIVAGNHVGAILNPANSAAIAGNGPLAGSLSTTDPWANFSR